MNSGCSTAYLGLEGTQASGKRELFTIGLDKIVGPTLLKTSLRNMAGMQSEGLDEGLYSAIVSFNVHIENGLKIIEQGRRVAVWRRRRATSFIAFILFVKVMRVCCK